MGTSPEEGKQLVQGAELSLPVHKPTRVPSRWPLGCVVSTYLGQLSLPALEQRFKEGILSLLH